MKKNSHCSFCGAKFAEQVAWPRKCFGCYNESYSNPLPVAVALVSVWDGVRVGALIQQRNIEPKKGLWALSGGYMNSGELWQEAAARELLEEIGLQSEANDYELMDVKGGSNNTNILVFGACNRVFKLSDINFIPNEEVLAVKIIHEPIELAFPSHTEMLARFMGSY